MGFIKKMFCLHFWVKPFIQGTRPNEFRLQYEWRCNKCKKLKWSNYENVEPEPNYKY